MIIFKYDKKIDTECWQRLIRAKAMFGMNFPTHFKIGNKEEEQAVQAVVKFGRMWSDFNQKVDVRKKLNKIYEFDLKSIIPCYINTSSYSMDNFSKGYISISIYRNTPRKLSGTVIHELSHYLFRKKYTNFCKKIGCTKKEIEDVKEILTVINNDVFPNIDDKGYDIHQELRKNVLKMWKNKKNIRGIIKESLNLLRD